VPVEEELRRVVPVIERLARECALPISVDTSKPEVMRAAVAAGAGMINDPYALRRDGALEAASALGVPVCLMHMQGTPQDMQDDPRYEGRGRGSALLLSPSACSPARWPGIARKKLLGGSRLRLRQEPRAQPAAAAAAVALRGARRAGARPGFRARA
jgi:dihydropteroate synthase